MYELFSEKKPEDLHQSLIIRTMQLLLIIELLITDYAMFSTMFNIVFGYFYTYT